jgi:hypothetical protein
MFTSVTAFSPPPPPPQSLPFVMVVKSDNAGTSTSTQFTLTEANVSSGSTFDVNFSPIADPTNIAEVTLDVSNPTITFPSIGTYIVRVDPTTFNKIRFNNVGDRLKLLTITQWGDVAWGSLNEAFSGCSNMDVTATDYPNLGGRTDGMFLNCSTLVGTSAFADWDTSASTIMTIMFSGAVLFNQDISGWDTSNSTSFSRMFFGASAFNQNISGWDVSKSTNFFSMFRDATSFNQNLGSWQFKTEGTFLGNFNNIFENSAMSCANYTDTIVGWANYVNTNGAPKSKSMTTQSGRRFANDRSGGAAFADSAAARTYLTGALPDGGWTISGDTVAASC